MLSIAVLARFLSNAVKYADANCKLPYHSLASPSTTERMFGSCHRKEISDFVAPLRDNTMQLELLC